MVVVPLPPDVVLTRIRESPSMSVSLAMRFRVAVPSSPTLIVSAIVVGAVLVPVTDTVIFSVEVPPWESETV